jgi:predicted SAM-dependent methyltransferase
MNATPGVRVNLGAGHRGLPGWLNVDIGTKYAAYRFLPVFRLMGRVGLVSHATVEWIESSGRPPPNLKTWDLRRRLPLRDASVSYVYCAEVLEHLRAEESSALLVEVGRVLVPGGLLRLSVPDVDLVSKALLDRRLSMDEFNLFFYVDSRHHRTWADRLGAALYSTTYHQWMFNFESMTNALSAAGLADVRRFAMRVGRFPELPELEGGLDWRRALSMYVEASK